MKNSMSKLVGLTVIVLLSLSIVITSCKKKKEEEAPAPTTTTPQEDLTAENDFALAENTMGDANREADVVLRDTLAFKNGKNLDSCRYIDYLGSGSCYRQVRVSYFNCVDNSGKVRNGSIKITAYGCKYDSVGTNIHIDFEDFYINQLKMSGYREMTHKGIINGKRTFSVFDNCTVTDTTNDYIHWEATRIHTWEAGFTSPYSIDDVYKINSRAYYESNRKGVTTITLVSIKNLVKAVCCPWPVSGEIEVTPSSKPMRTISFGDPLNTVHCYREPNTACDSLAKVTIGTKTYDIVLK